MSAISELLCPVCGKVLTSDEFKHAIEEITAKLGEEYQERIKKERSDFEEQIQNERKIFQEKYNNATKNHSEQLDVLRNQLATSYNQQFEELKKKYEDLDLQRQKSSRVNFDGKTAEYKHKMDELSRQIVKLQQESQGVKGNAINDARIILQKELHSKEIEIHERDAQIRQYKESIEELKQRLSTTQPERRGEAGEQDLLEDLRRAFPEDQFNRQTRGISEGDIIQRIRKPSGILLKVPIVYDNKEVARITKKEIEKQQYYKEHEQTDHLLLVSPNLPKSITNGVVGRKEGIMLVRRDIVVDIAGYLRNVIMEIAKNSESKKDQETKQARIYDYITSREFSRKIESLDKGNSEIMALQDKEEKDHQTMWKKKRAIIQRWRSTYIAISSEIDAIIQGQLPVSSKNSSSEKLEDDRKMMAVKNDSLFLHFFALPFRNDLNLTVSDDPNLTLRIPNLTG